jgi:DNA-binding transcriptional LysR family regulator
VNYFHWVPMSTKQLDLNLFVVFAAVMRHRNVAAAARELGLERSAVSKALGRLRAALGDPLFVSGPGGMEPTELAIHLTSDVTEGLTRLTRAVALSPFVPQTTARTFHIAAGDYSTAMILPSLMARITVVAPQVHLRVFPANRLDVIANLDDGRIDLAFGWFDSVPERMRRSSVAVEREVILVREGHPLTEGEVTTERLLSFRRIVVELTGSEEQAVAGFLDERGSSRRVWIDRLLVGATPGNEGLIGEVAMSVPYFSAVPSVLQLTDMVAVLPQQLALRMSRQDKVVVLDTPYQPAEVRVDAVWHERIDRDAGGRWLIDQLLDIRSSGREV